MANQPWENVIDRAAEICGGQNALARRLGIDRKNLSAAKLGKKPMAASHIEDLAEIVGMDPAELWLIHQDRRNPFRQTLASTVTTWVIAALVGILGATLTLPAPAAEQATARVSSRLPIKTAYTLWRIQLILQGRHRLT